MTDPFEQAARAERSRKQRQHQHAMRTSLRIHAAVFAFIQLLLVAIWALSGAGSPWFVFPLLGWGAGLAAHFYAAKESSRFAADEAAADLR